jgi:hypothetical protein
MKHTLLAGCLLLGLLLSSCSDDGATTESETALATADAAEIIVENVAIETGGILDEVEVLLLGEENGSLLDRADAAFGKDRRIDEAVFDSTTCTWTRTRERTREGENRGHSFSGTRTLHLMDSEGGCIMYRDTLGSVKGMDASYIFEGTQWNRRGTQARSGEDQWQIREMNDEIAGAVINGTHVRQGEGELTRHEETHVWEFTLQMTAQDVRVLHRDGRRVPVEGTVTIVFDGMRDGETVHREATITFGDDGGGELVIGEGRYDFSPLSGELQ